MLQPSDKGNDALVGFCGPENINLDNPNDGDQFVVSVNDYNNTAGSSRAHTHVNIYCNGARVVSAGYNPLTPGSATTGPLLLDAGKGMTGDIWEVATVKWDVGNAQGCRASRRYRRRIRIRIRDGAGNKAVCVDSATAGAPVVYKNHKFVEDSGVIPATPAGFCKH